MRHRLWIWVGRGAAAAILTGLAVYLLYVGPEIAVALIGIGVLVAVAALVVPYLLPAPQRAWPLELAQRLTPDTAVDFVREASRRGDIDSLPCGDSSHTSLADVLAPALVSRDDPPADPGGAGLDRLLDRLDQATK